MDEDTRQLLETWASDKYINIPNELFDRVKAASKTKKVLASLVIAYLLKNKLPESISDAISLLELSNVPERSYWRHWKHAVEIVELCGSSCIGNYTKFKTTTILKLIEDIETTYSDKILYWEIAKQNAIYQKGNKANNSLSNYCGWIVFTKRIKMALNNALSEKQILRSIESLHRKGFITAKRMSPEDTAYPRWLLKTADIDDLSSQREVKITENTANLVDGFKDLFSKYSNDTWSEKDLEELNLFFRETRDRNNQPWERPLNAIKTDLKTDSKLLLKSFYSWRYDKNQPDPEIIKYIEEEKKTNQIWANAGGLIDLRKAIMEQ